VKDLQALWDAWDDRQAEPPGAQEKRKKKRGARE
jgi:hypothetical protein